VENDTNKVFLYGMVASEPTTINDSTYEFNLAVKRLSAAIDTIPVRMSLDLFEYLQILKQISKGTFIAVKGKFCSYNKIENDRSHLILYVAAYSMTTEYDVGDPNIITLSGYVCKEPNYRITPLNREVADLCIAVNSSDRTDYLPAIAWGENADFAKTLNVGDRINISGRIQSREYQKKSDGGQTKTRVAYEVSISKLYKNTEVEND
jgi:primosomal replication protein N